METLELIAPEQYVIQKPNSVDIQSLNTHLVYDPIRKNRIYAMSTFADLVSSYDLVVQSIASLSLQRFYLPK